MKSKSREIKNVFFNKKTGQKFKFDLNVRLSSEVVKSFVSKYVSMQVSVCAYALNSTVPFARRTALYACRGFSLEVYPKLPPHGQNGQGFFSRDRPLRVKCSLAQSCVVGPTSSPLHVSAAAGWVAPIVYTVVKLNPSCSITWLVYSRPNGVYTGQPVLPNQNISSVKIEHYYLDLSLTFHANIFFSVGIQLLTRLTSL